MSDIARSAIPREFKNRKTGLIVFGVLQILFGLFFVLMVIFMAIGLFFASSIDHPEFGQLSAKSLLPGLLMNSALAIILFIFGVGSIQARRWARALILVCAWLALVTGLLSAGTMMFSFPKMYSGMTARGEMSAEMAGIAKTFVAAILFIFYILIPGIFVLFYRSENVKATCEHYDRQIRWTDHCPLPVLLLTVLLGFGAFSLVFTISYGGVFPFFGVLISGLPGYATITVLSIAFAYLAYGIYKMERSAWLGTIILFLLLSITSITTFRNVSLIEMYEKMNFPAKHVEMMKQQGMLDWMGNFPMLGAFSGLVFLAYVICIGKYFKED